MKLITPEISWHGKEPLFSVDFSVYGKFTRLASCGADYNIRIWSIHSGDNGDTKVDFRANLSRHTKAVNVVRFSPQGNVLASGGDDCFVIIWRLDENSGISFSQMGGMNSEDVENKESWQVVKMLRGHIEDVYDLAWSPSGIQLISGSVDHSVIIWDTAKGDKLKLMKDHRQYVQGVCWDPCGVYLASYSSDGTCRIYTTSNYRCCFNINKMVLPGPSKPDDLAQNLKQIKLFHDETMPSFFRRLTFSPDGSLLLVPGGRFEVKEQAVNTTYVFTKASMNKPVLYFPAGKKPTVAVRCCPILFEHRKTTAITENTEEKIAEKASPTFKLPYRMVIAVASLDSVVLYDTQQTCPFAFISNMHYASLTDITWSNDGRMLAVASRDGYCSLVTFEEGELGIPYSETARQVIEKSMPVKEASPGRKNALTPKTKNPETSSKERAKDREQSGSPKIDSLFMKNYINVNSAKPSSTTGSAAPISSVIPTATSKSTSSTVKFAENVAVSANADKKCPEIETVPKTIQSASRRVSFVTLSSTSSTVQPSDTGPTPNPYSYPHPSSVTGDGNSEKASSQVDAGPKTSSAPRRVQFVTIKPATSSAHPPNTQPNPPIVTADGNSEKASSQVDVDQTAQSAPRRVPFFTIKPATSTAKTSSNTDSGPSTGTASGNDGNIENKSSIIDEVPKTSQPIPRKVEFVTLHPPPENLLHRTEKPPVPLEPEVIIIKD